MSEDKFIWNRNAALFEINSRRITQEQRERMERDAMAWQLFLALRQAGSDWQWSNDAKFAYDGTDAFLAERKRQQGEA